VFGPLISRKRKGNDMRFRELSPVLTAIASLILMSFTGCATQRGIRLPDLTVIATHVDSGRVTALIANRGSVAPSIRPTTTLFIYKAGKLVRSVDAVTPAILPGQSAEVTFDFVVPHGAVFQVMVDSDNRVAESDETNNRTANQAIPGGQRLAAHGITVDPALRDKARSYRTSPLYDRKPRPVAAARFPYGQVVPFVENELMITTKSVAEAEALAARYAGKIVRKIDRPAATGRGPTYVVRVNTSSAPKDPLGPTEDGFAFSSQEGMNLLAIARHECKTGTRVSVNLLSQGSGLLEGMTVEAKGNDGLSLDYMRTGGSYDVDVARAWKALFLAGKTSSKPIVIGIVDGGFDFPRNDFFEADLDIASQTGTGGPNQGTCSGGAQCNWHGTNVAEAAAGIPDDKRGSTGPGGPIARILAVDTGGGSSDDRNDAVWTAFYSGANIINMSFHGKVPRDEHWYEGAWVNWLEDFENDTVIMNDNRRLLFASAGNDGEDVDAVNDDGDESDWYWPCENRGVICVGGWLDDPSSPDAGKVPAPQSNYGTGGGETVDIWGPWCTMVGDDPDTQGSQVLQKKCGTSFSSPMVAGVAALIWAVNPQLSNNQVWDLMNKFAIEGGPLVRRVHAFRAVREALMSTGVNTPPTVQIGIPPDSKFSQVAPTNFQAVTFDVEDGNACCNATWTINGGVVAGSGTLMQHTFGGEPLGQKTISVTITDSGGKTATASVSGTLENAPPTVKITSKPAEDMAQGLPSPFHADVMDLDVDSLGFPVSDACPGVSWTSSDGPDVIGIGCGVNLTFPLPGPRTITVSYTDSYGAQGSDSTDVIVAATPPGKIALSILIPTPGSLFSPSETIPLHWMTDGVIGIPTTHWTLKTDSGEAIDFVPTVIDGNTATFRLKDVFPSLEFSSSSGTMALSLTVTSSSNQSSDPKSVNIEQAAYIK
jgi:serine protease